MGFVGLLQALVLSSLGDLLSFCMPKKKVSKEKGHPTSPSMAKNAIDPPARFTSNGAASVPRK
jgi:hypothetical protein